MKKRLLNRRQFLVALSASTVGALYLTRQAFEQPVTSSPSSDHYVSKEGLLDVSLDARYRSVNLAGREARLYSYNGSLPGPRLEVKPGDTVRIRFTNNLPDPTNLHYHGLHVSPSENADNAFLEVPPGETFTYEFTIPQNHPAGTFWYHPHRHGLVAKQVFGGLSGLLIVRGELDDIPEIQAAQEEFLVLKDFALGDDGHIQPPNRMERMMQGREGSLVTVNGSVNPNFSIPEGGLLRLRLLNASSSRFYRLMLQDHPLHLIATDGGALGEPVELKELLLTPGERAEVLIRGEREPGEYLLLNLPYDRSDMGMMGGGMMGGGMMGRSRSTSPDRSATLATLTYKDRVKSLPLPEQLIPVEALPEPQKVRRFTLGHGMAPGQGMAFTINGKTFNSERIDTQVRLNTVEDWEIANEGMMMGFDHPFHLHTNAFQVISRNGKSESYRGWKDTVPVPPGDVVRIRIPFKDFPGKAVYHCHILDHEDLGMMGVVKMQQLGQS